MNLQLNNQSQDTNSYGNGHAFADNTEVQKWRQFPLEALKAARVVIWAQMTQISELVIYNVRAIFDRGVFELSSLVKVSQAVF